MENEVAGYLAILRRKRAWLPLREHRLYGYSCLWRQRDVTVLVVLDLKPEIQFRLYVDETMDEINVGEFEHRLLAGPEAGVAREHEPFDPITEKRGPHARAFLVRVLLKAFVFFEREEGIMDLGIALHELHSPGRTPGFRHITALFGEAEHRLEARQDLVARDRFEAAVPQIVEVPAHVVRGDVRCELRRSEPFEDLLWRVRLVLLRPDKVMVLLHVPATGLMPSDVREVLLRQPLQRHGFDVEHARKFLFELLLFPEIELEFRLRRLDRAK